MIGDLWKWFTVYQKMIITPKTLQFLLKWKIIANKVIHKTMDQLTWGWYETVGYHMQIFIFHMTNPTVSQYQRYFFNSMLLAQKSSDFQNSFTNCLTFWPRAYYAKAVLQFDMLLIFGFDTFVWNDRIDTNAPFCLKNKCNYFHYSCCPGGLAALAALLPWRPCRPGPWD